MGVKFKLFVKAPLAFIKARKMLPFFARQAAEQAGKELLAAERANIVKVGGFATGYTHDHISYMVQQRSATNFIAKTFPTTKAAESGLGAIEFGRKRGATVATYKVRGRTIERGKMPPRTEQFLRWLDARGIPRSAEFLIRRRIASHDIKGRYPLRKTRQQMRPRIKKIYNDALKRLIQYVNGN